MDHFNGFKIPAPPAPMTRTKEEKVQEVRFVGMSKESNGEVFAVFYGPSCGI